MYSKNCPECNDLMFFETTNALSFSKNHNVVCKKCKTKKYVRQCPKCGKDLHYTTKHILKKAIESNSLCRSCINSERLFSDASKEKIKKSLLKYYESEHGKETKEKLKSLYEGKTLEDLYGEEKAQEIKDKLGDRSGSNNSMYGKRVYDVWVEKYGKEDADKRLDEFKETRSKLYSGKGNPMYGKPSPQGSGNGWSGWYKGWFFRSLKELSYMINVIERFNINWESGESHKYKIKYVDWEGTERNYFPDFILENKYMIEIKPKNLFNSDKVKRKSECAVEWCKEHNFIYKLVDVPMLSTEKIIELYKSKDIIFLDRYEQKFLDLYLN